MRSTGKGRVKLVLACGNTLRGDDGVGWKIAEGLMANSHLSDVKVVASQQWLPEMAEQIRGADTVIFVDCSAVSLPGEVAVTEAVPAASTTGSLTHNVTPGTLLALALELYGTIPRRSCVVTVGGDSFELSEQLTPRVQAALPQAIRTIEQLL